MNKLLLLSIFFLFSCSSDISKLEENNILHDDSMRTFYSYIPSMVKEDMTLVIGLHGYTGDTSSFIRKGDADFNNFLEINNFIGTYPEGK